MSKKNKNDIFVVSAIAVSVKIALLAYFKFKKSKIM